MDLKDIATISGKSGLFKVVKPTRTGVILEALDAQRTRSVAGAQNRVSLLKEISIYTTGAEGSVPLEEVLRGIYQKYGKAALPIDSKSDNAALAGFMGEILPEFDRERVYPSDMRKLAVWYGILVNYLPELFESTNEAPSAEGEANTEVSKEETVK